MKRIPLLSLAAVAALALSHSVWANSSAKTPATVLATIAPHSAGLTGATASLDGVVEAVRQTALSAQVAGAVVALHVKAGDTVRAGQPLVQIDARAAQQQVAGSTAQVEAAQAALNVASKELERQKQLQQKQYISQAALDRTQAQWEAAQAQVKALQAQTRAAQTQSGFFVLLAPYAGVVREVSTVLGDMALPGRPLLTVYDPSALRITAHVPQTIALNIAQNLNASQAAVSYAVPGVAELANPQPASSVQLLPTVDPVTHTMELRIALPKNNPALKPGMFARVGLPGDATGPSRLYLPISAIVRRGEMSGVYVLDAQGQPRLRQVRLGRTTGQQVEILSGLRQDDKVVATPASATTAR
jgi:multidrug efflux system membrane fusion protein